MTDRFTIEIVPNPVYEIELTGRGPQGVQGPKGDTGATGPAGPAGPQGPKGDRGDSALSFTVGETTELPTSNSAYVENVGTDQDIVLDFGIPRGLTGASGKGVDIGSIIQSLSKVAPDGFVHTWGESISQEENPELYQACVDGTLPTVNASNGGVSTIYAPNGIFKQTAGTNTLDINSDVVMELAKIGGVVDWNGSYNPQPTGNITLASLSQNTETQILMFTEGGQNEVHFRFLEGSYSGKLSEAPSNPANNTLYFNTTDKTYYIYEGGDWNQYGASGVGYIYLGGIIVTADPATATWDNATFVSTDVTTTGLSEYDQQLVANKGNCGYFGLDTTELSVRVPTMQNVFLEENDTEVGSYKEAGLPNITGNTTSTAGFSSPTGAFYLGTSSIMEPTFPDSGTQVEFDASKSNPIYGNSDTVQPEAIAVYFYVCVSKYTQLEQGPYFTPHVDSNGVLSWTNNGGLVNPPNVDIKGPKGDDAFTLSIGEVTTLGPDQQATITNVGTTTDQVWDIGIPQGEQGRGAALEIGDIGIAPLGIDETKGLRRYLNGQVIIQDQFGGFTAKLKSAIELYPSLACTESEWQTTATMTVGGQVGKFVVDDEAGTIRLPKIIMPIQGLTDLSKLSEIVGAGLPNIAGTTSTFDWINDDYTKGAFVVSGKGTYRYAGTSTSAGAQNVFDASRYDPIYGNSDTVQQEQIQYPYFIQVATGTETEDNIINEIELNNPFFFGMSQYFGSEPNNISWHKSEGQYNPKAVYSDYYDWLLKIYNGVETVDGVSVKLSTETFTDYDFVINTADETFRLPLLNGSESLIGSEDIEYELPSSASQEYIATANGLLEARLLTDAADQRVRVVNVTTYEIDEARVAVSGANGFANVWVNKGDTFRITCNKTSTVQDVILHKAKGNGNLYYYVGETVQNANLINAGRIEEKLVDKVDTNANNLTAEGKSLIAGYPMPSSRSVSLTVGASGTQYTAPANGWFYAKAVSTGAGQELTFTGRLASTSRSTGSGQNLFASVPILKNDPTTLWYGNVTIDTFMFVYAEGDK